MSVFFTSFDEAWGFFVRRTEPLEVFYEDFSEDEDSYLEGWVVEPPPPVKTAAAEVQARLSHLDWLVPVPDHFLHIWIGSVERIGDVWKRWKDIEPFSVEYTRINCFHSAVVVEVEGAARLLVEGTPNDGPSFLPHMTLAVTREPGTPSELREALLPLRESVREAQIVAEAKHVRFPAARTTLFRPWTVQRLVSFR